MVIPKNGASTRVPRISNIITEAPVIKVTSRRYILLDNEFVFGI